MPGWSLLIDGLLLLEEHKKGALVRRKPVDNFEAVVEDQRDFWAADIFLHDEIYLRSSIINSAFKVVYGTYLMRPARNCEDPGHDIEQEWT